MLKESRPWHRGMENTTDVRPT